MAEILQFEEEIGRLEARISHLEDENEELRKLLEDRDSFSATVAVKIHKMDCLLDKRMTIITDLLSKLEKRTGSRPTQLGTFTWNYPSDPGQSGQDSTELDDFSMDLGPANVKEETEFPAPGKFDEKVYLEHLEGKPEARDLRNVLSSLITRRQRDTVHFGNLWSVNP